MKIFQLSFFRVRSRRFVSLLLSIPVIPASIFLRPEVWNLGATDARLWSMRTGSSFEGSRFLGKSWRED